MADALTVFLVRHAAHDRLDRILSGRMPGVRLGERGHGEARAVAERLAGEEITALYASPLERSCETAGPIGERLGLPVATAEAFNEIDCGEWTGLTFEALHADERWHIWNRQRAASATPGGEGMADVRARALAELRLWQERHPGGRVAVVTHSDVIKAVVCGILGLSLDRHHAFDVAPASISTIVLWPDGGKVIRLNESVTP